MSTMEQVIENVRVAGHGKPNSLSKKELRLIDEAGETYRKMFRKGGRRRVSNGASARINVPQHIKIGIS